MSSSRLGAHRGRALFVVAGLSFSAVFLWLAVRNADLAAVAAEVRNADAGLVALAVGVLGCGYLLQALRWRRIARVETLRLGRFYAMVLGGLACNNVLPIRVGELLRARWLSQDAPMPGGRAFGTVVLDRACDLVTLSLFLLVGFQAVSSAAWLVRLTVGVALVLVALTALLVFARMYAPRRARNRGGRGRARRLLHDTLELLAEPIGRRRAATWLGLSFGTWTLGSLAVALVGRSVGIELTPIESVFVAAALSLGVADPSSPGYVGTYQWLGVASLGLLDVPVNEALAFAILMQAAWYVPTTVAGGALIVARAVRPGWRRRPATPIPSSS